MTIEDSIQKYIAHYNFIQYLAQNASSKNGFKFKMEKNYTLISYDNIDFPLFQFAWFTPEAHSVTKEELLTIHRFFSERNIHNYGLKLFSDNNLKSPEIPGFSDFIRANFIEVDTVTSFEPKHPTKKNPSPEIFGKVFSNALGIESKLANLLCDFLYNNPGAKSINITSTESSNPVGALSLTLDNCFPEYAHSFGAVVLPDFRNKGHFLSTIAAAATLANESGIKKIFAEADVTTSLPILRKINAKIYPFGCRFFKVN